MGSPASRVANSPGMARGPPLMARLTPRLVSFPRGGRTMAAHKDAPRKKKTKRNKLSPRPTAKDIAVAVDPSLKAAWDRIAKRIDAAARGGAELFDELWEAAAEAIEHDPPLYVLGGYKSPA